SDTIMVLKHSFNLSIKEVVNEIKMQHDVDYHANIIKFYGLTKLNNKYLLVMEFADGGTLHSYLKENFKQLEWSDKYKLAFQLANAVSCTHNEGIIHGDLHAKNVLVYQNNIKLADFGLSHKTIDTSSHPEKLFGVVPYVDPKYFNNAKNSYTLNPKSDVYSVGVLFWQISSGHRPFKSENKKYDTNLVMDINKGRTEKIVTNTPKDYSNLYETEAFSLFLKAAEDNYPIAQVYLSICYKEGFGITKDNQLAFTWLKKSVDNIDNIIYGQLNLGIYYENIDKNLKEAFNWYQQSADNGNSSGLYHLGRCYELGKGINKCEREAFQIYTKLSEKEVIGGKFRLGICYYFGIGTDINKVKAFNLCKDLAEKDYDKAQVFLGYLYDNSEGTEKNLENAIYWYNKAAENMNESAQCNLDELDINRVG
ncbi:11742_t:CDS:2, partial [Funneliformis geosporum]